MNMPCDGLLATQNERWQSPALVRSLCLAVLSAQKCRLDHRHARPTCRGGPADCCCGSVNIPCFRSIGNKKSPNVISLEEGRTRNSAHFSRLPMPRVPSLVEGFGLPPLEAMTLGCPVVMSDRASLPEIGGDAVLYASPCDENAWFDCFMRLVHEEGLKTNLIARGRARAARFQWAASAQRYSK